MEMGRVLVDGVWVVRLCDRVQVSRSGGFNGIVAWPFTSAFYVNIGSRITTTFRIAALYSLLDFSEG